MKPIHDMWMAWMTCYIAVFQAPFIIWIETTKKKK